MDFVTKTLGSFSLSSSPFAQGAALDAGEESTRIWRIYEGTVKKTGQPCTLFVFDATQPNAQSRQPLAENTAKMLRKLRIPGLLKIIDSFAASSGSLTIATEPVKPVATRLGEFSFPAKQWALQTLLATLENLHKHTHCVHFNIQLSSVFETANGEWVLGGFELAGFVPGDSAPLASFGSLMPNNEANCPPEIQRQGWQVVSSGNERTAFAVDAWQYGRLIQQVLGSQAKAEIQQIVKPLMAVNRRSLITDVAASGSVMDTPLTRVAEWAANPYAFNEIEFEQLLHLLAQSVDDAPVTFVGGRVLPEIAKAIDANKGGLEAVRLTLALACRLDGPQFEQVALPVIVKLFASLDRAVRLELLYAFPKFIAKVPNRDAQTKIMPAMGTGFADTEALIRRESLNAIRSLAPKLSNRQLNGDLLRLLAKTNSDPEADIRATTILLLSDIAELMDQSTRSQVVVTALARGLRDPTTVVRKAALGGLHKTSQYFAPKETAEKLVGPAAGALLDGSAEVRAEALEVLNELLDRIKKASDELDDVVDRPPSAASATSSTSIPSVSGVASMFSWSSSPAPPVPQPAAAPALRPARAAAPVVPVAWVASATPVVSAPAPVSSIVQESAVYQEEDWGWDEPAEPVVKPKPKKVLVPKKAKPVPAPAPINVEPETTAEDDEGWDW